MKTLSHERTYGREELIRTLLRAGQFAHLSEATLHSRLTQAVTYSGEIVFARWWGVPPVGGPNGTFNASFACWLALATGSRALCCLCGKTDSPPAAGCAQLARAACPTWLQISGPPRMEVYPFCRKCDSTLDRLSEPFKRTEEWTPHQGGTDPRLRWSFREERDIDLVLSLLLVNPSFRGRVEKHADTFARLRFDPRREPERQAA